MSITLGFDPKEDFNTASYASERVLKLLSLFKFKVEEEFNLKEYI